MATRKYITFASVTFLLAAMLVFHSPAYALTLNECTGDAFALLPQALSQPIVYCIKSVVSDSVVTALGMMTDYFRAPASAVFILALVIHGVKLAAGEKSMGPKTISFLLRLSFVAYFTFNMGELAGFILAIADELLSLVGGAPPWEFIDNLLSVVLGVGPGIVLFQGLIWLGVGLFSGTAGFGMASALIVAFIELLLFIIEIIYTFLTAFIVVAFMLIFAPMFVPMLMFQYTERLFKKWVDTIIGAMLVPVFLSAFLYVSLGVYVPLIKNVFVIMLPEYAARFTIPLDPNNPPDFKPFWRSNQPLFGFSMVLDHNYERSLTRALATSPGKMQSTPPTPSNINPWGRGGFQANPVSLPGIVFGLQDKKTNQKLMFAFISLWLYTMILKQLIRKIPGVAQEIAGVISSIQFNPPSFEAKKAEIKSNVVTGSAVMLGGALGREAAAASGSRIITGAGALAGGGVGYWMARKAL